MPTARCCDGAAQEVRTIPIGDLNTTGNVGTGILTLKNNVASSTATFQVGSLGLSSTFAGVITDNSVGGTGITAISKTGTGTWTISNNNTYTGATSVNNGTLVLGGSSTSNAFTVTGGTLQINNVASSLIGTNPVMTVSGGGIITNYAALSNPNLTLNINGGGTFNSSITAGTTNPSIGPITLTGGAGAATLSLVDATPRIDGITTTALTLGGTAGNPAALNFDLGPGTITDTDNIAISGGKLTVNNQYVAINLNVTPGFTTGTYPLISYSGGKTGTALTNANLATTSYGLYTFSLDNEANVLNLVVSGTPPPTTAYWYGNVSNVWNDASGGATNPTNWYTSAAHTTNTGQLPGGGTDVYFAATSPSHLNTTLGDNFNINSLHFNSNVGSGSPVTIGGSSYTLGIGAGGITVDDGSGAHVISTGALNLVDTSAPYAFTQNWYNNSASAFTVNAPITGDSLTALALNTSRIGGALFVFNGAGSYSGGTTINSGVTLQIGNGGALGTGPIMINSGGILDLHGQTLTVGAINGYGTVTNNSPAATINFNVSDYSYFGGTIQDGAGRRLTARLRLLKAAPELPS